jgi:hypothetical protein
MLKYHIQTVELTSTQASISLNEVPQTYDDLILTISGRSTRSGEIRDEVQVRFNQDSNSNYTLSGLRGSGSSIGATASNGNSALTRADMPAGNATANTFSNISYYISNYKTSTAKSVNIDTVMENNATDSFMYILAGLWNNTAPITNISMRPEVASFASGTTVSLYGLKRGADASLTAAASGGVITASDGYTIHTFSTSGTFVPNRDLNADVLVVAGGGGGGGHLGAGGGAGGFLAFNSAFSANSPLTVTVGAGGAGGVNTSSAPTSGANSTFNSQTAIGGGRGGGGAGASLSGGSGGGGQGANLSQDVGSGAAGTTGQGFAGGNGSFGATASESGGGGGASAAGGNATTSAAGNGGAGSQWLNGKFYAGGGGGGVDGRNGGTPGIGGVGGGGNGVKSTNGNATSGTANTGGGGGGGSGGDGGVQSAGGNGGSGVVIIRYLTP